MAKIVSQYLPWSETNQDPIWHLLQDRLHLHYKIVVAGYDNVLCYN